MAKFYVPDYYDQFHCKGGACRRTCCRGWNITLNMGEYFSLRSVDASPGLNSRIENGLEIISDDKERYAAFVRTQDGSCPLLREDGLCALQAECGEGVLPSVCREYPRSVRTDYACELALSSSCEAVTELLMGSAEPLGIVRKELHSFAEEPAEHDKQTMHLLSNLRKVCVRVLQDRALPIPDRIAHMHALLYELHSYEERGDMRGLYAAAEELVTREFPLMHIPQADWIHLAAPLALSGAFFQTSPSLGAFWPKITSALHLSQNRAEWTEEDFIRAERRYALLKGRFADTHPQWQEHWERLMVNYAFYTRLPFSDRLTGLKDEALSLAACYAMTRFAAVTVAGEDPDMDVLVDIVAAVMRLIEHSGFDRRCVALLRQSHMDDEEHLRDMLLTV